MIRAIQREQASKAKLDVLAPDGRTIREHLRGLAKRGDKKARRTLRVTWKVPPEVKYLYHLFVELDGTRNYADGLPLAISHTEIRALAQNYDIRIAPHEVRAIKLLDNVRRAQMMKTIRATRAKAKRASTKRANVGKSARPARSKRVKR